MIKKIAFYIFAFSICTSCVSKKIYTDLEGKYTELKKENRKLSDENASLSQAKSQLEIDKNNLKTELDKTRNENSKLNSNYEAQVQQYKALQDAYTALEKNSNESLQSNMNKNRELLVELEEKGKALTEERDRLNQSSQRLKELEERIATKEASMKKLKETLSKALNNFEGKGLTVQQKEGKVYVSMENKLLFNSGSWAVSTEGKKAVEELGNVLGENPDIAILIEGHTDDDAFTASGPISDNWDLSTKRATSIVAILSENKKINKQNLTAAGRGEFSPLAPNTSSEGKAKNRRIEIILTPRLDTIAELLNEIN